jgi:hypothetical protein
MADLAAADVLLETLIDLGLPSSCSEFPATGSAASWKHCSGTRIK